MQPAIFLDRDGVIIENRLDYVRNWEQAKILPGALASLARISKSSYKLVIVTNQAGIGRGLISRQTVDEINEKLVEQIEQAGGRIHGIYVCPHSPDDGCDCRKPQPGMIWQAARELDIDLKNSILVGDNLSDLQAGRAAGIGRLVLVRTGLGNAFAGRLVEAGFWDVKVFDDLEQAVSSLVKEP
jgi:histidinol-phosphate phosphatase family protein